MDDVFYGFADRLHVHGRDPHYPEKTHDNTDNLLLFSYNEIYSLMVAYNFHASEV